MLWRILISSPSYSFFWRGIHMYCRLSISRYWLLTKPHFCCLKSSEGKITSERLELQEERKSLLFQMSNEKMMHCPYNMAHVILKQRMAAHLVKCRVQHPVEEFETCPFNSTHDVPAPELQYHTEICPDRKQLEKCIYVIDEPKQQEECSINIDLPSSSENWDEESTSGGSYLNVKDKELEKQMVFRLPVGMSKNERKTFLQNEVQRFEKVLDKNPSK